MNRIEHRLSFYELAFIFWGSTVTSEEHIREVYAYFGLAIYWCQVLEHGIVNAMVVMRVPIRHTLPKFDMDEFMDDQFENTLGKMIKNLRSDMAVPNDIDDLLKRALKTRNWLCHNYFRERAVELVSEEGREKMLVELKDARSLIMEADTRLSDVIMPILDKVGITEEVIEAEINKQSSAK